MILVMVTLIDFIKNVEDEVYEKVLFYTRHQEDYGLLPMIWVHQLKGKVRFADAPRDSGYARLPVYKLCGIDNEFKWVPDKKAIKKWIEGEVLMHSLRPA